MSDIKPLTRAIKNYVNVSIAANTLYESDGGGMPEEIFELAYKAALEQVAEAEAALDYAVSRLDKDLGDS